jgi:hypothetical protein
MNERLSPISQLTKNIGSFGREKAKFSAAWRHRSGSPSRIRDV